MAQVDSKFVDLTKTMKADITATIEQHFAEQNKGIDKKIADVSTKMDGQIASLRAEIDKNKMDVNLSPVAMPTGPAGSGGYAHAARRPAAPALASAQPTAGAAATPGATKRPRSEAAASTPGAFSANDLRVVVVWLPQWHAGQKSEEARR